MSKPITYLALLRGINVGGNNIIKMIDLKSCFEKMGLDKVKTYIQSGNVIFQSSEKNSEKLTAQIEKVLSKQFNYHGRAVLISQQQLKNILTQAPAKFGQQPTKYRYDVLFLKPPLTTAEAFPQLTTKPGIDQANFASSEPALYFQRLIAKATSSHLSKIIKLPIYQNLTIRNWNTTTKLAKLMEEI
jgi:uncharacterized protein (DUF1697 family)